MRLNRALGLADRREPRPAQGTLRGSRVTVSGSTKRSRPPDPGIRRHAPRRLAPWSEKLASPVTKEPGISRQVVIDPQPAHREWTAGIRTGVHMTSPVMRQASEIAVFRFHAGVPGGRRVGEVEIDTAPKSLDQRPRRGPVAHVLPGARRYRAAPGCRLEADPLSGSSRGPARMVRGSFSQSPWRLGIQIAARQRPTSRSANWWSPDTGMRSADPPRVIVSALLRPPSGRDIGTHGVAGERKKITASHRAR